MENDFTKKDDVYDPNFSIDGSNTEKLDMYGVWLKNKKVSDQSDKMDFSELGDMEDDSDENTMNFDDAFSDTLLADEQGNDHDDTAEIDEFKNLHKEDDSETVLDGDSEETPGEEDFESLDLDDFFDDSEAETAPDAEHTDADEPAEIIDLDFLEEDEPEADTEKAPAGLESFNEISLEDFEDETITDDSSETHDELEPLDDLASSEEDKTHETEVHKIPDSFDISVTVDDEENKTLNPAELSSQPVDDSDDIPIFDSVSKPAEEKSVPADKTTFFDDVKALEQDLLAEQKAQQDDTAQDAGMQRASSASAVHSNDKATALLIKIAHEISDLKEELNNLKAGLAAQSAVGHETKDAPAAAAQTAEASNAKHEQTVGGSGFFSDDDTDETIALTGDELNNILITADFTEEKNTEEDEAQSQETVEAKTVPTMDDALDGKAVFDIEPAPVTSVAEDLSYLDNPEIGEEELAMGDDEENPFTPPQKQEIEVPHEEMDADHLQRYAADADQQAEDLTIHELDTDEQHTEPVLELDSPEDIPELPVEEDSGASIPVEKQETLLQSASQIVNSTQGKTVSISVELKNDIKSVLAYMDQLLEALPEKKIEEFARSEYFETYKHLFEELGIS